MGKFKNTAAISLILAAFLAVITMAIHPSGGNMQTIVKQAHMLHFSHSIALACLPLFCFGCYGLAVFLKTENRISMLAFFIMLFGLLAGMLAGLLNGIVLPNFLSRHITEIETQHDMLDLIIHYGFAMNRALGHVLIVSVIAAVVLWAFEGWRTTRFGVWLAVAGWLLAALGIIALIAGFKFISVTGFTAFVFGLTAWFIAAGISMLRSRQ
jgi:hypothetical protein